MVSQNEKKAFTLVELLVVISIIAILMAILMPALQMAKDKAKEVLSMANMRGLGIAWMLYATENEERLVGSDVNQDLDLADAGTDERQYAPSQWVKDMRYTGMDEDEAIRQGALFPYVDNVEVYHSPGDRNAKTKPEADGNASPFRSYAISDPMNGRQEGGFYEDKPAKRYMKITNIRGASDRLVFIEEEDSVNDGGGAANWGSWIIDDWQGYSWNDSVSAYYGGYTTILGFADGRAQRRIWENQTTFDMIENQNQNQETVDGKRQDITFMKRAYHHNYRPN